MATHTKTASGRDPASRGCPDPAAGAGDTPADGGPRGLQPPLVVIAGPTASGKSALAIYLAKRLNGEIVNYDSVQVYRGLDIGSGKVPPAGRLGVPHHLLGVIEPDQHCTAGYFRRLALATLTDLRQRGKLPVLVGGTGLYLRALLEGLFDGPERSSLLRARLKRIAGRHGSLSLHRMLRRLDAKAAARIHANDGQKVIRALEICLLAGEPVSTLHARGRERLAGFTVLKTGLNPSREELYRRINVRVESMFAAGLIEETQALLLQHGDASGALLALGYRQARAVLEGEMGVAEAVRATQAATRRYAKRQLTWLRRESDVKWWEGVGDDPDIQRRAFSWLRQTLSGGSFAPGTPEDFNQHGAERSHP